MREYMPRWLRNAVPFKDDQPWKCKRYSSKSSGSSFINDTECPIAFDKTETVECNKWIFATEEITIVNDVSDRNLIFRK